MNNRRAIKPPKPVFVATRSEAHLTILFWFVELNFAVAGIAQLVERNLAKVEVASSSLVSRSKISKRRLAQQF